MAAVGIKSNWAVKAEISAFNSSHKMYFFKSSASSISDYRGKNKMNIEEKKKK